MLGLWPTLAACALLKFKMLRCLVWLYNIIVDRLYNVSMELHVESV